MKIGQEPIPRYTLRTCLIGLALLSCLFDHTRASAGPAFWDFEPSHRKLATVSEIQSCLSPACAKVVFPGSPDYEAARGKVYNHRNLYMPAEFVFATSVEQVQNAVKCAVTLNIGISPRSGGHSYEDYSLGGRDGVLVVDLGGMKSFSYDSKSKTTIVGPGFRVAQLKLALWNAGKVTVPSGTCPSIGVGGHALGGGWGFVARKFGIMADNILEAQVVINNGSVVMASAEQNSDLFRALKGAGANSFGIVTEFKFQAYDVSKPVTYFNIQFSGAEQFQAIKAYQVWGASAASEISASLFQAPSGTNYLFGVYLGPQKNFASQVQTFLSNAPTPTSSYVVETDYINTVLINAGFNITYDISLLNLGNGYVYVEEVFKAKSIMVKGKGLSDAGIHAFVSSLQAGPNNSFCIFDLFGGSGSAINKKSVQSGDGWVHRDALMNILMFASWETQPQTAVAETTFVEGIWNAVRPYSSSEAYQNYIDVEEPLRAYYGTNLDSLIATKRKWDSKNVFRFNQSIPLD
ncbi:unnamed protein product [Calypogeia fissa]